MPTIKHANVKLTHSWFAVSVAMLLKPVTDGNFLVLLCGAALGPLLSHIVRFIQPPPHGDT